jgi:sugar phosphate permease
VILALGLLAQTAMSALIYGVPFLVPAMRATAGMSLAQAGAVVAAPTVGLLCTLIAWGAAADRYGERVVMATGLGLCGLLGIGAATWAQGALQLAIWLGLAGAAGASVSSACGRAVMGWFPVQERGLAMGIRQTCTPLGIGLSAAILPVVAQHQGYERALLVPSLCCVAAAVLVALFLLDPPRLPASPTDPVGSPYRTPTLWRLHTASAFLVVPQFALGAFALEYLVSRYGWAPGAGGAVLAVVALAGAAARLGAGIWSDRVGSRLRPMRQLAIASAAVMLGTSLGDLTSPWLAIAALAVGSVITVADNGLGYTATAELAGPVWTGRAIGAQNTAQNIAAAATAPLLGAMIGGTSYAAAFAVVAVFPLVAIVLTPVAAESFRAQRSER